jgi:hypothetical protein
MKRDLVRVVVNGMLLAGLIGFCAEASPAQNAGETLVKTKCAATDEMGKAKYDTIAEKLSGTMQVREPNSHKEGNEHNSNAA